MVITVHCPECATSFPVDTAKVPAGGVKARCSSCSAIFRVERPAEAAPPPPPAPAEPDEALSSAGTPELESQPARDVPATDAPSDEPHEPLDGDSPVTTSVETPEVPGAPESAEDWVFETEEDIDPDSLRIEPVGTLEESLESAKDEVSSFGADLAMERAVEAVDGEGGTPLDVDLEGAYEGGTPEEAPEALLGWPEETATEHRSTFDMDFSPRVEAEAVETEQGDAAREPELAEGAPGAPADEVLPGPAFEAALPTLAETTSEIEDAAPPAAEPAPPVTGFTFGRRDPHDKARRLARVLASDIKEYNRDRYRRALSAGSLKEDFEEEIEKSWKEYVEQVGLDIARNTPYWSQALNDVLAQGQNIF